MLVVVAVVLVVVVVVVLVVEIASFSSSSSSSSSSTLLFLTKGQLDIHYMFDDSYDNATRQIETTIPQQHYIEREREGLKEKHDDDRMLTMIACLD